MKTKTIAIIGGGAAGFFGAINCAEANRDCRVVIFEKTRQLLTKVKISGGGRCNVTHACFDPAALVLNYPRGGKELRGPFSRFQPRDTIQWFESRGVELKTENDGRMFPITDQSSTIIDCLLGQVKALGIEVKCEQAVVDCERHEDHFVLSLSNGEMFVSQCVLVATGGSARTYSWLEKLGHTLVSSVPSLFTFNIPNSPLHELAGISVENALVTLEEGKLQHKGPLLITHWGFSGPAVLKLSAWGARLLHDSGYKAAVRINWLPEYSEEGLKELFRNYREAHPNRFVASDSPCVLPKNLWKALVAMAGIPADLRWTVLSKIQLQQLLEKLQACQFQMDGKSTYKEEFVTSGGVKLSEVNFKTMESRLCPGLYFAGEVLDIDGVTGGFNFQNAWTTSWLAAQAMAH